MKKYSCRIRACTGIASDGNSLCIHHILIGIDNPDFTDEDMAHYISPENGENQHLMVWQNEVRRKYSYKCCKCKAAGALSVFNATGLMKRSDKPISVDYGLLLCKPCLSAFRAERGKMCIGCFEIKKLNNFAIHPRSGKSNNKCELCC
jgi:hypothetical protein